jgi:hypothetical protein
LGVFKRVNLPDIIVLSGFGSGISTQSNQCRAKSEPHTTPEKIPPVFLFIFHRAAASLLEDYILFVSRSSCTARFPDNFLPALSYDPMPGES